MSSHLYEFSFDSQSLLGYVTVLCQAAARDDHHLDRIYIFWAWRDIRYKVFNKFSNGIQFYRTQTLEHTSSMYVCMLFSLSILWNPIIYLKLNVLHCFRVFCLVFHVFFSVKITYNSNEIILPRLCIFPSK